MTRFESMQDALVYDVANGICDYIADKVGCENCHYYDRCYQGHNGVLDYLQEKVDELENKS